MPLPRSIAERVRASIDALKPFGGVVKVTASIGVAVSDTKALSTPDALIKAADQAMYVAKFTTKNPVFVPGRRNAADGCASRSKS